MNMKNINEGYKILRKQYHVIILFGLITALAFFFAMTEIQIEGPNGWAQNLPTWRIEKHPLLDIFWGGKPLTGYHLWLFSFMFFAFHLPHAVCGKFNIHMEERCIGSFTLFWVIEDALWFLLNPAFGLAKFRPEFISWHRHWIIGMPVDYVIYTPIGAALIYLSYKKDNRLCEYK